MYFEVAEGQLYIETMALSRQRPLLFLHGFTLDSTVWTEQIRYFQQSVYSAMITMDLLGFGRSDLPNMEQAGGQYSNIDHIKVLLDRFNIPQVHLVGMSMGGGVAIDFAIAYPNRVASLTLSGAICHGQPWSEEWIKCMQSIQQLAKDEGVEAAKLAWRRNSVFAGIKVGTGAAKQLLAIHKRYSGWHWLHRDPVVPFEPPAFSRLRDIQAPVLAIVGERDIKDFKLAALTLLEQLGPQQCQFVEMLEAGHLPSLEVPLQFNQRLHQFLDSVEQEVPS